MKANSASSSAAATTGWSTNIAGAGEIGRRKGVAGEVGGARPCRAREPPWLGQVAASVGCGIADGLGGVGGKGWVAGHGRVRVKGAGGGAEGCGDEGVDGCEVGGGVVILLAHIQTAEWSSS